MKKLLGILILGLFLSGNAFADRDIQKEIFHFNKWLYDNEHYELVEKIENEKCKSFDKGDTNWYYNNCDEFRGSNNLNIKIENKRLDLSNWTVKFGRSYSLPYFMAFSRVMAFL